MEVEAALVLPRPASRARNRRRRNPTPIAHNLSVAVAIERDGSVLAARCINGYVEILHWPKTQVRLPPWKIADTQVPAESSTLIVPKAAPDPGKFASRKIIFSR